MAPLTSRVRKSARAPCTQGTLWKQLSAATKSLQGYHASKLTHSMPHDLKRMGPWHHFKVHKIRRLDFLEDFPQHSNTDLRCYLIHYVRCEACCIKSLNGVRTVFSLNYEVVLSPVFICSQGKIPSTLTWICISRRLCVGWFCCCIAIISMIAIWMSCTVAIVAICYLQGKYLSQQSLYSTCWTEECSTLVLLVPSWLFQPRKWQALIRQDRDQKLLLAMPLGRITFVLSLTCFRLAYKPSFLATNTRVKQTSFAITLTLLQSM